jgi:hypothetical protein
VFKITDKITSFLNRPLAFISVAGGFAIALTGCLELIRISCTAVHQVDASVCVTTSKTIHIADSVAKDKNDSLKLDLGEVVCDHDLLLTRHDMEIQAMIDPKLEAQLRPVWLRDSIRNVNLQKRLGLRR